MVGTQDLIVQFDQALQPGPVNGPNWIAEVGGAIRERRVGTGGTAVGDSVIIPTSVSGVWTLDDVCFYSATPADVVGLAGGVPAAAFGPFPFSQA